ncbi:MAG TPA: N-acetylneuraminate synthase family protein [Candidatus Paceibacterota bacterium]|nr:N-acetylneuraminate synthase family protein [Candidatus Paceibacterota bacterium]
MAITIRSTRVGPGHPCYIVAELGINHNGDVEYAKQLIDEAVKCGANAVKFQKRTVPVVYETALNDKREVPRDFLERAIARGVLPKESVTRLIATDFADTRNGDQKYGLELTEAEYRQIDEHCKALDIPWSASPWDEGSVDFLERFDVPFYKVASASLTDDHLLRHIRSKGKPVVLSTGGSSMEQIRHAVGVLGTENLVLLQCTAAYPKVMTPETRATINLRGMDTLRNAFPTVPVGFSSNDGTRIPALFAAALGAVMVEVHLTLSHRLWGSDQASSMEPVWFRELCEWIRVGEECLGDGQKVVYPEETAVMKKLRRVGG